MTGESSYLYCTDIRTKEATRYANYCNRPLERLALERSNVTLATAQCLGISGCTETKVRC